MTLEGTVSPPKINATNPEVCEGGYKYCCVPREHAEVEDLDICKYLQFVAGQVKSSWSSFIQFSRHIQLP